MSSDLIVEFGSIEGLTVFPDDQGTVTVTVTNQGDEQVNGPITLDLFASTDAVLDRVPLNILDERLEGTDELLGRVTSQAFNLAPDESTTLTLDFARLDELRTPSVVSPGAYYVIGQIDSNNIVVESNEGNNVTGAFVSTEGTDVVLDWNSTLLNAIQALGKGGAPGIAPPLAARNMAIVHAAIYDAVNAIEQTYSPYHVSIEPSEAFGASPEAAVVGAAYQTLINLFPTQAATFEAQRFRSLAEISDGSAEDAGFALGVRVANKILELRSNDGADAADDVPYTPGRGLGDWRPTPPTFAPALLPGWGEVTPFGISSVEDVVTASSPRLDGPPDYGSEEYLRDLNEVLRLGERNSTERTEDQTQIALFWAYDRPDTFRPPGHWNEIAQEVTLQQGNTLVDNARLFAMLNIAMADAGIVAWDRKYTFNQLRPITAIRQTTDLDWTPLLNTPPFPDYISGHAAFAGAAGQVLRSFFGSEVSFDITSQELPGIARTFSGTVDENGNIIDSFTQAVREDALSRIYAGVHVPSSQITEFGVTATDVVAIDDGIAAGRAVSNFILDNII